MPSRDDLRLSDQRWFYKKSGGLNVVPPKWCILYSLFCTQFILCIFLLTSIQPHWKRFPKNIKHLTFWRHEWMNKEVVNRKKRFFLKLDTFYIDIRVFPRLFALFYIVYKENENFLEFAPIISRSRSKINKIRVVILRCNIQFHIISQSRFRQSFPCLFSENPSRVQG